MAEKRGIHVTRMKHEVSQHRSRPLARASRARFRPLLALLSVLSFHGGLLLAWIRLDQDGSGFVCCGMMEPIQDRLAASHLAAALPGVRAWTPAAGILPWIAARVLELSGGSPDFPLFTLLGALLLSQLLVFLLARQLSGPWTGVLAAFLLPAIPAVAFVSRRFDVHGPQMPLLLAGGLLLLCSRGLTRLLPGLGFALVLAAAACFSPRPTDNALLMLALLSMAGASALRSLLLGKDAHGAPISRVRCLAGNAVLWTALLVAVFLLLPRDPTHTGSVQRTLEELQRSDFQALLPWWHWRQLTAYTSHLYWRALTPALAIPVELAMLLFLWRGRGRAEIAGWVLGPLLLLSLIPKKNFYYVAVLYPVLPLVLALGISRLRPTWLAVLASLSLCGYAGLELLGRSLPGLLPLAVDTRQAGDNTLGGLMQSSDYELDISPVTESSLGALAGLLDRGLEALPDSCRCPYAVATQGVGDPWSLWLRVAGTPPCTRIYAMETEAGLDDAALLLRRHVDDGPRSGQGHPAQQDASKPLPLEGGFPPPRYISRQQLLLYQREAGWFEARCELLSTGPVP